MNVAIVMDNNVAKRQVTPFEIITQTEKDINFVALIGEKNRHDTASIRFHKIFLNHRSGGL